MSVSIVAPAPLLNHESIPGVKMEVVIDGRPIKDPCVIVIRVANSGRLAIKSDDFDRGRPITFALGVPIVKLLEVSTDPQISAVPDVSQGEQCIMIGPDLIHPGHSIIVQALTSGEPSAALPEHHLIDTIVERAPEGSPYLSPHSRLSLVASGMGVVIAIAALLSDYFGFRVE